jgi:uncharacterized membrane protein
MKRNSFSAALTTALFALALVAVAPAMQADEHHGCSFHGVSATYGYSASGIRNGIGPAASVGTVTLDKDGNAVGAQTASFNGVILTETFTGTYTVNDDCTGSTVLNVISSNPAYNRTSTLNIVWDDDTDRFRMIFTSADTIITGDGQRMH